MEPKIIEMAALGRALFTGMLYDCRNDTFIPGVTLWDKASLTQDLDVHRRPNTDLKFSASDSLSDKANLLDVSASLKASFLGGLVEVGGSAKYLKDQKSSAQQSRVTLQYSQTARFEQLTMTQLGKITYPQVFEEKTATHVVTAVLYGSQVFMVFDRTNAENEDKQVVEGNLHVMVKKIPSFSIEGEGALKMNEKEKKLADSISCTFYGDCVLEENPTTYIEALQLYKKLPSLLKQRENDAVPLKVWLHPLAKLDSRAAKLEREISLTVITKIEGLLEDLGEARRKYGDLDKSDTAKKFPDVRERLQKFQKSFSQYEILFKKALSRLLPAVRGGEVNEKELLAILSIHYRSPFVADKLMQWLENVQGEIDLLNSYTMELSGVPIITSTVQLKNILHDPNVDTVVCFSFTSMKYEDPYLSSITEFLTADEFEKLTPNSCSQDIQAWFHNLDISEKMKENVFLFKSFADANKDKIKKTRFVIASVSDSSNPGTSIHLYRKGKMVDSKFQPVSKPPVPSVDIQDKNVILKLQKSPTGVTVRYRVEYRITQPDDSGADGEKWEFTETPDAQETFTLTALQLANQYQVRYRAISDVGMSEASDSVRLSFQGKAIGPVGQSWDWSLSSLYTDLWMKTVTSIGSSRWSLSTIQSEVSNRVSNISAPYVGNIPGQLKPGMALFFQGVVPPNCHEFAINHKTGPKEGDDVVFHFNPRLYANCVVCANFRNGNWENSEFTNWTPIYKGSAFDIIIITTTEGYDVYVNGFKFCFFNHRIPLEKVTTLSIKGDVFMNYIGIVPNWSTSTFYKKLNVGTVMSDVALPVCQPSKPYVGPITGGLRVGLALFFQGVVPADANGFAINLKAGPGDGDDVVFHFNPRVGTPSVVRDSFRNGKWENPEETWGGPFLKGGYFDIFMVVKGDGYEVIVNGYSYCTFKHRFPLERVSVLHIKGDVFMHTFGIMEVENVNIKVKIPAHISRL